MSRTPYQACREELEQLFEKYPNRFRELFHQGRTSQDDLAFDLGAFLELGLVSKDGKDVRSHVAITRFEDTFIATDFINSCSLDRVFPVYPDESFLLAMWPRIYPNDVVLDLCTGSGVVAIIAKKRGASRVVASDITSRSKKFFDLNVALNACEDVEYVHSDVLKDISDTSFTLVTCNPPFVPVPDGNHYFVHSAGGALGTDIVEKVLQQTVALRGNARLYMTCLSLGSAASWRMEVLCEQSVPSAGNRETWQLLPLYHDEAVGFSKYFASLPEAQQNKHWAAMVKQDYGYDRIGYLGLAIDRENQNAPAEELAQALDVLQQHPPFGPLDRYCWSMEARMRRYNAHVG